MRKQTECEIYTTQIRMSDALHERIMRIANETGDSLNGTMLNLIDDALLARGVPYNYHSADSSGTCTGPCSRS